jgi:hypothetical protein
VILCFWMMIGWLVDWPTRGWIDGYIAGEEESEMVQNIFNVLCSALMVTDNQVA